jgi:hypothetical protein
MATANPTRGVEAVCRQFSTDFPFGLCNTYARYLQRSGKDKRDMEITQC